MTLLKCLIPLTEHLGALTYVPHSLERGGCLLDGLQAGDDSNDSLLLAIGYKPLSQGRLLRPLELGGVDGE